MNGKFYRIYAFLLAIIPLIFINRFHEFFLFPKKIFFFSLCCIFLIFIISTEKKIRVYNPYVLAFLLVYIMIHIVFFSNLPSNSVFPVLTALLFVFIVSQSAKLNFRYFINVLNLSGIIVLIYAMIQSCGIDPFFDTQYLESYESLNRVFSTLGNKNFVSEFSLSLFLLNLGIFGFRKRDMIFAIPVLITFEKTALLFFAGVLIPYIFIKYRFKIDRRAIFMLLSVLVIFIIGIISFSDIFTGFQFRNILNTDIKNSFHQRVYIYRTSFDIIKEYAFTGVGPGHFNEAFNYYQHRHVFDYEYNYFCEPVFAHNELIHLLAEYGGIGFLLLFFFVWPLLKGMYASGRFRMFLIYLLYQSMFSFPLRLPSIWVLMIIPAGYVIRRKKLARVIYLSRILRITAYAVLLLSLSYPVLFAVSSYYLQKSQNDDDRTSDYLKKSTLTSPGWYKPYYERGIYFFRNNDYLKAKILFYRALKTSRRPYIFFYLGMTEVALGNKDVGVGMLEKFVTYFPLSWQAHSNLYRLYKDTDKEKADFHKKRSEILKKIDPSSTSFDID